MRSAIGTGPGEDDGEVGLRPSHMVVLAVVIVLAALGLFVASTFQAVTLIDERAVEREHALVARLLVDDPSAADATPSARALHVAALAGLRDAHVGAAADERAGEVAQSLPAPNAGTTLIWSPYRPASAVFNEVAPYRLIIVGLLIPILVLVLLRFRAFTTELDRQRRAARRLAARDSLTGLANRLAFDHRLSAELARHSPAAPVALMLLDLNGFKRVNDTFGHAAGDAVLAEVADRLRRMIAPPALAARLGGDEFAVVMRLEEGADALFELVLDLHAALAEPYLVQGRPVDAPASIGIALAPEHGESEDELLRHADAALYAAKARPDRAFLMFDRQAFEPSGHMRSAPVGTSLH
ncbi:MAG: GGDEF domain-containing protein [Devosia sp.]|nr:GGDEF domain-containing protein [Devosia sp.]